MERCRISDDWTYKGMKVVFMENHFLRIGILADRGSDIFEFTYKPLGIDPLLRLEKGISNPNQHFSQIRNTSSQFEDYYYGGWQEILPNSPSFNYKGAVLGQHGEVSLIPWKYAIIENNDEEIAVKLWAEPLRLPLRITKKLRMNSNDPTLYIEETLENKGGTTLDIMWGHHIAFGLPFLKNGAKIETNAREMQAEELMPDQRLIAPGQRFEFPMAVNKNGYKVDVSLISPEGEEQYSELIYLSDFKDAKACYSIRSLESGLRFSVEWDAEIFRSLWLWQERNGIQEFPWWGKTYAVALEPWTSPWTSEPEKAIAKGEWMKIKAGEKIQTKLCSGIYLN
jgi:galactose mutarotase-like enzyme